MFEIHINQDIDENDSIIELKQVGGRTSAKINLYNGGSLQELKLCNVKVIKDLKPLAYQDTYASSIIFPFIGRIKNNEYTFLNRQYRLNEYNQKNALHGLLSNKQFKVKELTASENESLVILGYEQEELHIGFPFQYAIQLTYMLTYKVLTLKAKVFNKGNRSFPFSFGWHPYFCTSNLNESILSLNSSKKIALDNNLIATNDVIFNISKNIKIKDKKLNDCFVLDDSKVQFKTPEYTLNIDSSSYENYLLVYTINEMNVIAIEPLTASPNCFNNKKGLKVLEPNREYEVIWKIELETDTL